MVLVPRRRLDRRDDLARHAQLGEAAKRGLLVRPEIAHGLAKADQALLHEVLRVAARQEVGAGLHSDEARVAPDQVIPRTGIAVPRAQDELKILEFSLSLLR